MRKNTGTWIAVFAMITAVCSLVVALAAWMERRVCGYGDEYMDEDDYDEDGYTYPVSSHAEIAPDAETDNSADEADAE